MNDLGSIVETIQSAASAEEAFNFFETALNSYGYDNLVFSLMNDHPSIGQRAFHGFATSYPVDWLKHYERHAYHQHDPVWLAAISKVAPFSWDQVAKERQRDPVLTAQALALSNDVMQQAEDAGLTDGIGMSFGNSWGEKVGFGLSRKRRERVNNTRDLADVYLICSIFHQVYLSHFKRVELPHFTPRERDVLSWSADGKSDDGIADKLGITIPTVRFHWNNIFDKLKVRNKVQATMIAVQRGIVSPCAIGSRLG